jgi:hypothetical protein
VAGKPNAYQLRFQSAGIAVAERGHSVRATTVYRGSGMAQAGRSLAARSMSIYVVLVLKAYGWGTLSLEVEVVSGATPLVSNTASSRRHAWPPVASLAFDRDKHALQLDRAPAKATLRATGSIVRSSRCVPFPAGPSVRVGVVSSPNELDARIDRALTRPVAGKPYYTMRTSSEVR